MNSSLVKKSMRRGRRPGSTVTRTTIAEAARACFARRGYDGTTMRAIAEAAAVDPALIHHYFRTKRALFEATLALPDPSDGRLFAAFSEAKAGEAIIAAFLALWDPVEGGSGLARLIRSAATEPQTQARLADLIATTLIAPAVSQVRASAGLPKLRAALVAAQLAGLAWLRYVLKIEPIATASPQLLAKTYGPSIAATLGIE